MVRLVAPLLLLIVIGWRSLEVRRLPHDLVPSSSAYTWSSITDSAAFPGAYNFPVFSVRGEMWAFHPRGNWHSRDAKTWVRSELPAAGLNSGYQKYVLLNDAVYALGTMEGDYTNMRLGSRIARTRDFQHWEIVASGSNLPHRVFYGAVAFEGKIWLMGGFDGTSYYDDVWNSADGAHWTRVTEHAGWSRRKVDVAVAFKGRMWIIGGGVIDGDREINATSGRETWSSADGSHWTRAADRSGPAWGGTPAVFDGQLWLVGVNRNSMFAPAALVTSDGITWREEPAPWSPRGAPAVWVFNDKLYMTGGKYSVVENGARRFVYSNDVWQLSRSSR